VIGHGSGKVILLGEHAVVHGVPAIAAGLSVGASARARDGDAMLTIAPWGVTVRAGDDTPLGSALSALVAARRAESRDAEVPREHAIDASIELPGSAGLGSSAALGVATLRALDAADGITRDFDRSQSIALAWERVFHGNPSGIDTAVALSGGLVRFRRHPGPGERALEPLGAGAVLRLVVGHSGEPGSTKETVARVGARKTSDPVGFDSELADFRAVVAAGERALLAGELDALGASFDRCHALLARWGVSTTALDAMCERARDAGALGAKLTGGGGGGCMIALVRDETAAHRVRAALASMGREAFETTIGETKVGATDRTERS
jgi:mevalonate kinase